jgi:hypothetical protein
MNEDTTVSERGTSPFEYLLNAMELAAQSPEPAKLNYAAKRQAVLDYVRTVAEIAEARDALVVAYRTNSNRRSGPAIDRIHAAEYRLGCIVADHHARIAQEKAS